MKKKEYIYPEMEIVSLTGLFMQGIPSASDHPDPTHAPPRTDVF